MADFMSPSCVSSNSYTSFSERHLGSHHLFSSSTEPESVGRQALIQTLDESISSDEQNVQNLLKAFDISVRDIQRVESESFHSVPQFPELTNLDIPTTSTPLRAQNTDHRHPFLSTPLRLKHFSKLSPTILRNLLRSPSVHADSPDGSFSDEPASDYFFEDAELVPESPVARVFPAEKENGKSADSDFFGAGPMTPPLTGRIPECAKLPCLSYAPLERSIDFEDSSPLKNVGLKPATADPEVFVSPFPSPPLETERHSTLLPTQRHHSMPAATIEQFRRVIDELEGPSRKSISERRDVPPLPKVHVKPRVHIPSPVSPPSSKKAGFLEVEFAGLLLERAENEDDEAEELSRMVDRLRHLAECRRVLARAIKD